MGSRITCYAHSGDNQVAYQTAGEGPAVAYLMGTISGLAVWEHRLGEEFFDAIARFSRLVVHDPRGAGRSDPLPPATPPTVQGQADDLIAVLDDASIPKVFVLGFHAGAAVGIELATSYPSRVTGLLLVNGWARLLEDDGYPGITPAFSEDLIEMHGREFGTGIFSSAFVPSREGDPTVKEFFAFVEEHGSSRAQSMLLTRMAQELDVRDKLAHVTVPTVVMHSGQNTAIPPSFGRYIADHIPDATYISFPGTDHAFQFENPGPVLAELETLVTGRRPDPERDRILTTVLFTDIVGSTQRAAALGDRSWRELLERHHAIVRDQLDRLRGHELDTAGDGFLAIFDSPGRAIKCAQSIITELRHNGIEIRAGIHTGECEKLGDKLGGIAVHIGARIASLAGPGQILVSSTVRDLTAGSGIEFVDRGPHELKGVPNLWQVYEVAQ
ncbi:MAG: adenylate/guanylate cyclase domain-containing protein [Acidimicrobiia bacterium]